jgi:hypothetical protein
VAVAAIRKVSPRFRMITRNLSPDLATFVYGTHLTHSPLLPLADPRACRFVSRSTEPCVWHVALAGTRSFDPDSECPGCPGQPCVWCLLPQPRRHRQPSPACPGSRLSSGGASYAAGGSGWAKTTSVAGSWGMGGVPLIMMSARVQGC